MFFPLDIENTPNMPQLFWHPSVVYIPEGYGGHKWWMAQSPYHPTVELKPYRARWELPCVHYSDDGIHWNSVPNNPIDDLTAQQLLEEDYLSDPHLVYKDGRLELYYRLTLLKDKQVKDNKTLLYRKTSVDGVHWSDREVIADLRKQEDIAIWGEQIISQAVLWDGEKYMCWYVDGSGYRKERGIRVAVSKDGILWKKAKQCQISDYTDTPWHIDVQRYDGEYHMLCYGDSKGELALLRSDYGLNWQFISTVLAPSKKWYSFYSQKIYRSCSVEVDGQYYVFFSAANRIKSYIGCLKTTDWKTYTPIGPKWNVRYLCDICRLFWQKIIRKIIKR